MYLNMEEIYFNKQNKEFKRYITIQKSILKQKYTKRLNQIIQSL